jgi:hypothetical protein
MANYQQIESMPRLLERATFRVRGKRADCARCSGRSRGTVSFTSEVAFCHRCGWSANQTTLARELGLLSLGRQAREEMRRELERRERLEAPIRAFEKWRDERLWLAIDQHRRFSRQAILAESVLRIHTDCELAWDVLANFHHREAALVAEIDRLSCTKLSDYLESPFSITQLFLEWRATAHAA